VGAPPQAYTDEVYCPGREQSPAWATNLLRYLVNHRKNIYNVENNVQRMLADHSRPVRYELPSPSLTNGPGRRAAQLYIHTPRGRAGRNIDDSTERFVDKTPIGKAD
jgi:hopanoid C-3 methylase